MTLKEWKSRLQVGTQLRCTYRWYWGVSKPAPTTEEIVTIRKVGATYVCYDGPTLNLNPGQLAWLHFPKASELKADDKGFEFVFPANDPKRPGQAVSRYEWIGAL